LIQEMATSQAFHGEAAALIAFLAAGEALAQSAGGQVAQQQPIIELRDGRGETLTSRDTSSSH